MARLPYPDEVSPGLRRLARTLLPIRMRQLAVDAIWAAARMVDGLDPAFREARARLAALRDTRRGETCIVIGNGPSLRQTDPALLGRVESFGLNRINLLTAETGFAPTYHVVVNSNVIEQFAAEIALVPSQLFVPWRYRHAFSRRTDVFSFALNPGNAFSIDASRGVTAGATVTNVALQLAYHMGFSRVLLVGVDHRFNTDRPPHEELVAAGPDENHFSSAYFSAGVRWNAPDLATSEAVYREARAVFEADGRRIVDCTIGGALTVFDKSTLAAELG